MQPHMPIRLSLASAAAALALLTLLALGCGGNSDSPPRDAANVPIDDAAADAADAGDAGSVGFVEPEDADEPIAPEMFEQARSMWQLQVDGMATQAQTLRQAATEHPDPQLNDLVKQLESTNVELAQLMAKATSPAQSRLLKVDIPRKVGEAGELAAKASARLMEVLQAKTGIGPGGG